MHFSTLLQMQLAPTIKHQAAAVLSLLERYGWHYFSIITGMIAGHRTFDQVRWLRAWLSGCTYVRVLVRGFKTILFYIHYIMLLSLMWVHRKIYSNYTNDTIKISEPVTNN